MPTSSPRQISDEPESAPTRKGLAADSPVHPVSLLAGAGSAAVVAVIGGQFGLRGTVIGAAVGSIVAAVTATTIRSSVDRSRAAAIRLATRTRAGLDPTPATSVAFAHADSAPEDTRWSGWVRRGATISAGFALGIAGLLGVQLGLGRYLSPGTEQLQVAAAKVVAADPTAGSSTRGTHPTATATTTVTETVPSTPDPSSSSTASQTANPVKAPIGGSVPSASTTPSATPTPSAAVATP